MSEKNAAHLLPPPVNIENFEEQLAPTRGRLMGHPLFTSIQTINEMCHFMENHVFAVWDFMSLLKTLQMQLTTTTVPWLPPENREAARLINEIVVGEESDEISSGKYISHFELYLEAMGEGGANTSSIDSFISSLRSRRDVQSALNDAKVSRHAITFVQSTLNFCRLKPHEVAAAFLFGREDIIPDMFRRILSGGDFSARSRFQKLKIYLERHIEVDGDSHGPKARRLMTSLCGSDLAKWQESVKVAQAALLSREKLWDEVLTTMKEKK